jgi:hypothetical protein
MVALVQAGSLAPPGTTAASATVIAVIVPAAATPSLRDALSRLRGEAESVGFAILLTESTGAEDAQGPLERIAASMAAAAVVALVERPRGTTLGAVDVWFLDCSTGKRSVGHVLVEEDAGDRAELVLAVRVVDFIRARMFDSLVRSSARTHHEPVASHPAVGPHYVAAGVGATGSFSGVPPSVMPSLELAYGLQPWLRLVLGGAGFGSKPRCENRVGRASLAPTLLFLGANLRSATRWRLFAAANLGLSVLLLSVHGEGKPGYLGHDVSSWSPGLIATAGGGLVLTRHLQFLVLVGGTVLRQEPKIYIDDSEVARTGRPAWLASAALGVSF